MLHMIDGGLAGVAFVGGVIFTPVAVVILGYRFLIAFRSHVYEGTITRMNIVHSPRSLDHHNIGYAFSPAPNTILRQEITVRKWRYNAFSVGEVVKIKAVRGMPRVSHLVGSESNSIQFILIAIAALCDSLLVAVLVTYVF